MMHATEIILNSILSACGAALFTGLCLWVKGMYKKTKTYDKALKALAHDAFFRCCKELLPHETLSKSEVENINYLYDGYHSLGLNGTGDKLYNEIIKKPVRPDDEN